MQVAHSKDDREDALTMARYFFNIREREQVIVDPEGQIFGTVDDARAEAVETARELLAEAIRAGQSAEGRQFEIHDDTGSCVAVVAFRDVI